MSSYIHADLGVHLSTRFKNVVPIGVKATVIRALVQALVDDIDANGPGIIGVLLDRSFDVRKHLLGEGDGKAAK